MKKNTSEKKNLQFLKKSLFYNFMNDGSADSNNVIMWKRANGELSEFALQLDISKDEVILPSVGVSLGDGFKNISSKLDFKELTKDTSEKLEKQICNTVDNVIFDLLLKNNNNENTKEILSEFNCRFIRKLMEDVRQNNEKIIQPLWFQGKDAYVLLVDEEQAKSLTQETEWKQQSSPPEDTYGVNSKIFENALGVYWGVIVYKSEYLTRINAENKNGCRALLLGKQAVLMAVNDELLQNGNELDFSELQGKEVKDILGIKTSRDPDNDKVKECHTFGVIHLMKNNVAG